MLRLFETVQHDPFPGDRLDALQSWRDRVRCRLIDLLGEFPDRVALDFETTSSVACDGYRLDRVVFDSESTMSVPAYLLVPDSRRSPGAAILAIHGHGPGKDAICGVSREANRGAPCGDLNDLHGLHSNYHRDEGQDYAVALARRGFVVLAPDLRCFGERADWEPEDRYLCDANLVHATMAGMNPMALNVWDLMRSLDVLSEHPLVDETRLGVVGFSYGATLSLFLSALDARATATVVSGFFSSWAESHKVPWNMCGSQVMFSMLNEIEHVDLGALICPRPLLIETGSRDLLFPLSAAEQSVAELKKVYSASGALDRLAHEVFDGEHVWYGEPAYSFLERWLMAPTDELAIP